MKVTFYNAQAFTDIARAYRLNPPLAPALLAAVFARAGHTANAMDLEALQVTPQALARAYDKQRDRWPDAVGFTVCSFSAKGAQASVRALRDVGYTGYIAVGGPQITMLGRGPIDELDSWGADAWVTGECEGNIVQVFEERRGGLIAGEQAPIEDIPSPLWSAHRPSVGTTYVGNEPRTGSPEWISMWTRGCPHNCTFCSNIVFGKTAIRRRPAANILDELVSLKGKGIRSMYIYDDELVGFPGAHNDWLVETCDTVAPLGMKMKAQGRCSQKANTPEVLRAMHRAGFRYVQWGVESFSQNVLDKMRKGTTPDDIWSTLERAHDAGLNNGLFLMVGNYGETEDDLAHTEAQVRKASERGLIQWAQVMVCLPMPGTWLYDKAHEEGWYREPPDEFMQGAYMDTPTMKAGEIDMWRKRIRQATGV